MQLVFWYSPPQPLGKNKVGVCGYLIVQKLLNCCFSQIRGRRSYNAPFLSCQSSPKFLLFRFFQWLAWEPEYNEGALEKLHRNHYSLCWFSCFKSSWPIILFYFMSCEWEKRHYRNLGCKRLLFGWVAENFTRYPASVTSNLIVAICCCGDSVLGLNSTLKWIENEVYNNHIGWW